YEVVRCRPGTVAVRGGPGSAVHRHKRAYARLRRAMALHRIRDTGGARNYLTVIFASRMTRLYSSTWRRRETPPSAPHLPTGKSPCWASLGFMSGALSALLKAPDNRLSASLGVFAGATMP